MPQSTPSIDRFTIDQATGRAEFDENTPSGAADGNPDNGLIITTAPTDETRQGCDGHPLCPMRTATTLKGSSP